MAIPDDAIFITNAGRIADLARRQRVPSSGFRDLINLAVEQPSKFELVVDLREARPST